MFNMGSAPSLADIAAVTKDGAYGIPVCSEPVSC